MKAGKIKERTYKTLLYICNHSGLLYKDIPRPEGLHTSLDSHIARILQKGFIKTIRIDGVYRYFITEIGVQILINNTK